MMLSDGEMLPSVSWYTVVALVTASLRHRLRVSALSGPCNAAFRCRQSVSEKVQSALIVVRIHWSGVKDLPGFRSW